MTYIISSNLGVYHRHPVLLELYEKSFTPLVKQQYGSVEKYLIQSLGTWNQSIPSETKWWTREMETKVKLNDWGYALPREVVYVPLLLHSLSTTNNTSDYSHWVIWTPIAVVHQDHCNSIWTWEDVSRQGLAGFTGLDESTKNIYIDSGGTEGSGVEISSFVKDNWKEDEFETIW